MCLCILSVYTLLVLCFVGLVLCIPLHVSLLSTEDSTKQLHRSLEMTCIADCKRDRSLIALLTQRVSNAHANVHNTRI